MYSAVIMNFGLLLLLFFQTAIVLEISIEMSKISKGRFFVFDFMLFKAIFEHELKNSHSEFLVC